MSRLVVPLLIAFALIQAAPLVVDIADWPRRDACRKAVLAQPKPRGADVSATADAVRVHLLVQCETAP